MSDIVRESVKQRTSGKYLALALVTAMALPVAGFAAPTAPAAELLYFVNTTSDTVVAGACANGAAGCSLRGAIQVANSHAGADGIEIDLPAGAVINLTQALPNLTESVSISGPGADKITVRLNTGGNYSIFTITTAGSVTFSGLTISDGASGINNNGGATVNVSNCALSGNLSNGIYNYGTGTVNVTNCTLSDNVGFIGGGIYNESTGTVNVINSTLFANRAFVGAGLYNQNGTVNVTNSTLFGNDTTPYGSNFGGAGIYSNGGTVSVTNSTITFNRANASGGGIRSGVGTVTVKSSIIALNTSNSSGPDVSGAFTSRGFNLIGKRDDSTGFTAPSDQTGTTTSPLDPKLDPNGLQNNGGSTQTIALLFGSPAIDKGTSNGLTGSLTTDQRGAGFARTFDDPANPNAAGGNGTDIGAFELQTAPSVLANISTRLRVETGDNVLIGGFIITGTQPKKVIVRGIGPSLPMAERLANPTLELRNSSGALLDSNDDWKDSPNKQAIIDSTIPPSNDLESAIIATLSANNTSYTAIVRGANDGTGIGVVEAYDLDRSVDSKLANISTRGFVQTGDNVLIAGTIVLGQASQKVIIRAIGPSLTIAGKLENPTLELRDANGGLIRVNDNWRLGGQEAEIIQSTVPPPNDFESAIVATLPAGGASYTAIVRGVNNTSGIAVVEVYALN